MKKLLAICLTILTGLCFTGCGTEAAPPLFLFGISEIKLGNAAAEREIAAFLNDFEREVSVVVEDSDVWKINHAGSGEPVTVSDATRDNLVAAKRIYSETEGAFNVALYPLTELWHFSPEYAGNGVLPGYSEPRPEPDAEKIAELLAYTDLDGIRLNGNTVTKAYAESKIDLGGIAKGYAAQRAKEIALSYGLKRGIINIGGSQFFIGEKEDGSPYRVGINDPRKQMFFGTFTIQDAAVATSGDYMRCYEFEGKRYCHILDGATGYPVQTGVASVTVATADAAAADAYATSAFVMGQERAAAFFEERGIASVIVFQNGEKWYYRVTGGMALEKGSVSGVYEEWTGGKN